MAPRIETFADIIAPIDEETFFATYHDRQPLHISAPDRDRFSEIMSWQILTAILNMTRVWSPGTLRLMLDKQPVPAEHYCSEIPGQDLVPQLQPDAELIKSWLRRGASLVANDVDTLSPALAAAATAVERRLGVKAQSNLYCSWQAHQAFDTHFDTHEVFALHVEGEKTWRVYEGRLDHPVANESFQTLTQEYHDSHRGAVLLEATLRPGDVLYIPRGYYHDALADSPSVHLAFGVTHPIGLDVLNILHQHAFADRLFRTNLPARDAGGSALDRHLAELGNRLTSILRSEAFAGDVRRFHAGFHYPRGGFNLPADAFEQRFTVHASGLAVVEHEGRQILRGAKGAVAIPNGLTDVVTWMIGRPAFSLSEFAEAFPVLSEVDRQRALRDMTAMKIIAQA